jgi:uncharacterized protein (DUF433 family)
MVGKPVIRGTRIPVESILAWLSGNLDLDAFFAAYPRTTGEDVQAALAFAHDAVRDDYLRSPQRAEAFRMHGVGANAEPDLRLVHTDPEIMSGKAVIRGTHIPVDTIVARLAVGADLDELFETFPELTVEDVRAALAFAAQSVEERDRRSRRAMKREVSANT